MSRTDKDLPYWVKAIHADAKGYPTRVWHRDNCVDYINPLTGAGPRTYAVQLVERAVATANGWELARTWHDEDDVVVYVRVPAAPRPCDVDTATGKCSRHMRREGRRYECSCCRAPRKPVRRAAERDWAREAIKEYRGSGGLVADPDWVPEAREYDEARTAWQSRYYSGSAW